eukprot:gb/GECH01010485.1/.p1 GENE.gb/GECH01010485.1/~~gb/GECH01010485.1/.p1  ORF type:complete len:653 (+),score=93.62 gb/GECH01010485.1/:1-1959(+)
MNVKFYFLLNPNRHKNKVESSHEKKKKMSTDEFINLRRLKSSFSGNTVFNVTFIVAQDILNEYHSETIFPQIQQIASNLHEDSVFSLVVSGKGECQKVFENKNSTQFAKQDFEIEKYKCSIFSWIGSGTTIGLQKSFEWAWNNLRNKGDSKSKVIICFTSCKLDPGELPETIAHIGVHVLWITDKQEFDSSSYHNKMKRDDQLFFYKKDEELKGPLYWVLGNSKSKEGFHVELKTKKSHYSIEKDFFELCVELAPRSPAKEGFSGTITVSGDTDFFVEGRQDLKACGKEPIRLIRNKSSLPILDNFPRYFVVSIFDSQGEVDQGPMKFEVPPNILAGSITEHLRQHGSTNILLMGLRGEGKSSFINSVCSMLSGAVEDISASDSRMGAVTRGVNMFSLSKYLEIADPEARELEADQQLYLTDMYGIDQIEWRESKSDNVDGQEKSPPEISLNTDPPVHVVIFLVSAGSSNQAMIEQKIQSMKQKFLDEKKRVLFVVSKTDKFEELANHYVKSIKDSVQCKEEEITWHVNYHGQTNGVTSIDIDRTTLSILMKALRFSNYSKRHDSQSKKGYINLFLKGQKDQYEIHLVGKSIQELKQAISDRVPDLEPQHIAELFKLRNKEKLPIETDLDVKNVQEGDEIRVILYSGVAIDI